MNNERLEKLAGLSLLNHGAYVIAQDILVRAASGEGGFISLVLAADVPDEYGTDPILGRYCEEAVSFLLVHLGEFQPK